MSHPVIGDTSLLQRLSRKLSATYTSILISPYCSHSPLRFSVLVLDEVLCSSNEVVKHVLLVLKHPRLVPTVAILTGGYMYRNTHM